VTHADVQAGKIIVRPTVANLLACGRVPGAAWDARRKAWTFPATARNAQLMRFSLKALSTTERFDSLLSVPSPSAPALPPVPAPEPALSAPARVVPGLLTQLPQSEPICNFFGPF
jgi:hypothetical protein